jgi:hypothetical protein
MQAPQPLQITVQEFGLWRTSLVALGVLLLAVLTAWCFAMATRWALGVLLLSALSSLGALLSLARTDAASLRWDGQVWALGPAASRGHEPDLGVLSVAVDLRFWMLLKFSTSPSWQDVRWLPVQRSGHALTWHALRATAYGAKTTPEILPQFAI